MIDKLEDGTLVIFNWRGQRVHYILETCKGHWVLSKSPDLGLSRWLRINFQDVFDTPEDIVQAIHAEQERLTGTYNRGKG